MKHYLESAEAVFQEVSSKTFLIYIQNVVLIVELPKNMQ